MRAILDVISEMRFFFLIFVVIVLAFGDSFKVMFLADPTTSASYDEGRFITQILTVFMLSLGEFGDEHG